MATVNHALTRVAQNIVSASYPAMANTDVGDALQAAEYSDKTVQVEGTWGAGGEFTLQGSNDGTNWATLNDALGTAIVLSADGLVSILEAPLYIRPNITAGDGATALNVTLSGVNG